MQKYICILIYYQAAVLMYIVHLLHQQPTGSSTYKLQRYGSSGGPPYRYQLLDDVRKQTSSQFIDGVFF